MSGAPTASRFVARGSAEYDAYMGRWSRRLAPLLLDFAPPEPGERVLDVGCGTGNLAAALLARGDLGAVHAIDYDAGFVATAQARLPEIAAAIVQGDACALPYPAASFDRALSMLVLHFVSDATTAAREMRRVLRHGGTAAACVWDTYGGQVSQRMFWDTAAALDPKAARRWANTAFRPATAPGQLRTAFVDAGFSDVTETMLTIRMEYKDFDDYWIPMIQGQGNLEAFLDEIGLERIRDAVRAAFLSGQPDGPRSLAATAWAVRGRAG